MTNTRIGYARCSTDKQDLTAQRAALTDLGVAADRIYTDHGFTGTNRARPGLDQAMAAVRDGDTLVVPKLDRLARSVPDARDIADRLAGQGPWDRIGSAPVSRGLNSWTWTNAPKGTWWIKVGMTRGATYGENMSTGPVTIGTDFSDVIKAEAAAGGAGQSVLALRAPGGAANGPKTVPPKSKARRKKP